MPKKSQPITILGIETSCDDTSVAVVTYENGLSHILSNVVSSQTLHSGYGGVVPNLAAREHTKNIFPVLANALARAHVTPEDITAIAVTNGPGLIPALLVGTTTARALSFLWNRPLLGIHHIEGHIYANFLSDQLPGYQVTRKKSDKLQPTTYNLQPKFPLLALVVSGGHTQLVLMRKHFDYEIVGETQDDAVGEAFDKVARILGLGYPGGPAVSKRAKQATRDKQQETSNKESSPCSDVSLVTCHLSLPRPMLNSPDFNFSFSGLKTAVLYTVQKFRKENALDENATLPDEFVNVVCAEFQQATIDVLVKKTIKSAKKYSARTVILAGGVSANTELRTQLGNAVSQLAPPVAYHLSPITLSTDNAAMIASAGAFRFAKMSPAEQENTKKNWRTLETRADLTLAHGQA
jgi:N6-L-threonylcarbamoyladenine synthase